MKHRTFNCFALSNAEGELVNNPEVESIPRMFKVRREAEAARGSYLIPLLIVKVRCEVTYESPVMT